MHVVSGTPIAKIGPHTGSYPGLYVCDHRGMNELLMHLRIRRTGIALPPSTAVPVHMLCPKIAPAVTP